MPNPEQFIFAGSVMNGYFVPLSERSPSVEGDYIVRVVRSNDSLITRKRLRFGQDPQKLYWMGGCRPFSSDDEVVAWFIPLQDQPAETVSSSRG